MPLIQVIEWDPNWSKADNRNLQPGDCAALNSRLVTGVLQGVRARSVTSVSQVTDSPVPSPSKREQPMLPPVVANCALALHGEGWHDWTIPVRDVLRGGDKPDSGHRRRGLFLKLHGRDAVI